MVRQVLTLIGNNSNRFTGILNGNGHKITGLWASRYNFNETGLFDSIANATIKNLGVEIAESKELNGFGQVGAIAGIARNSSISNSYTAGNISDNVYIGGIIERLAFSSNITNSYSTANIITMTRYWFGGIAGEIYDTHITNSYSLGNVSGDDDWAGGITGYICGAL
ncbi:MAG: hypothetical protein LBS39_02175 [Campylobacteraceae bacterium]|jgi:hypothetical protein|nr:hypothetical protein [Campylobacteraceae bacterium]